MLAEVKARLEAQVPELDGRVGLAAEFTAILKDGRVPSGGVNAYVLPGTTTGVPTQTMGAGLFVQPVRRGVSIATFVQSTDARGQRALGRLDDFLADIQTAICGWAPGDEVGVFELSAERPAPSQRGLMAFVTEFRINDQLRITT
ncbi:phage tail terminator protein [Mameliella alba]|uniref:phage tail terminator protein n=1 Tax=Mameliella alba TaxID=561184 RepID=UPI000B536F5B|nr:hypothetical protein [Mameliella alba]OWV43186.1 hypothetical protein CDZ95_10355 [Mameliella alba]